MNPEDPEAGRELHLEEEATVKGNGTEIAGGEVKAQEDYNSLTPQCTSESPLSYLLVT